MKAKLKKQNLNSKYVVIFAIVFALIGGAIILASRAATPSFGLYFSPSTSNLTVGSQLSVNVMANLGTTTGVQNITSLVTYDPTQLHLDSADQASTPSNFPVKFWCSPAEGCSSDGKVSFTEGFSGTATITPANNIIVGTIKFTVLKTGTAALTFNTDPSLSGFTTASQTFLPLTSQNFENGSYTIAPTSPVVSSPSQTDGQVSLSWTASNDGVSGANLNGYDVYRNGTKVNTSTITGTTYTDTGLKPSTSYSYTVIALGKSAPNSAASSPLVVSTKVDSTKPTVPTNVTFGAISPNSIEVNWTASTDNSGAAPSYNVYRNNVKVNTNPITTTTYTDTGLAASTQYSYTVEAVDSTGNVSAKSTANSATTLTPVDNPPSVPSNVTATATGNAVAITWSASTDDKGIKGYHVYRTNSSNVTTEITPAAGITATTITDTGVAPGTYSYTVKAEDTKPQLSGASTPKSVTVYSSLDLNKDGIIGISDLSLVLSNYGTSGTGPSVPGDANGDKSVNILDISTLLSKWGTSG